MFDKLIANLKEEEKEAKQEMVEFNMSHCVDRPEVLIGLLKDIETMSDVEAFKLVRDNYPVILSGDKRFNFAMGNHRFVTILTQVTYEVNLRYEETIHCNAFIYNYVVYQNKPDPYMVKLLLILGEAINKVNVNKLLGQELNQELAIFLAVSNNSTENMQVNIKRVNFTIAREAPGVMTVQKLIDIYSALYSKCFSKLFLAVMFDTTIQDATENGEYWITKDMIETNENITWAVMYILESLPPQDITRYLYMLNESFKITYDSDKDKIRMSLRNLPPKLFVKVPIIIEQMEGLEESFIIP